MKKILSKIWLASLILPSIVSAQTNVTGGSRSAFEADTSLPNPFGTNTTLIQVLNNLVSALLTASVLIATIVIIYAAFMIVTAGGDSGKVEQAKKTILYVVIGLGVILMFKVIIAVVGQIVGVRVQF